MPRKLPPFPALRAFEAAARLGSFRGAADELCVTPSAVSHQIRKLEEYLNLQLFDRSPLGPRLNDRGKGYLDRLSPLFDEMEAGTADLVGAPAADRLSIRGTPGFIARWLIPRLESLYAATGLEVRLSSGLPPTDFSSGDVDVIIHWGSDPVANVVIEPFLSTPKIIVASPGYLRQHGQPSSLHDLAGHSLLCDEVCDLWGEWLAGAGCSGVVAAGPVFAHCELALAAVERDQGIALAYQALVEDDIASGRLVRLFPHKTQEKMIYSIAYPVNRRHDTGIRAFRDWVFSEIGACEKQHTLRAVAG